MINYSEALELLQQNLINLGTETLDLLETTNKYLAEDILADRDYPPFNRSAMDGYAVNSEWYNKLDQKSLVSQGTCFAGEAFSKTIDSSRALKIMTGAPVPDGLDAVIKIEETNGGCDIIEFSPPRINSYQNIAKKGEDASKGDAVLTSGTQLTPNNLQVLATLGVSKVKVKKTPSVAILTTGDEVKDIEESVDWFQIRNSNKYSLLSSLKSLEIDVISCDHVNDNENELSSKLSEALKADIVLLTGGVSMGDADFVPQTLANQGIEKVFHKIAMKPGKPVWFGKNNQTAVFGLPGNSLSTFHCFHLLVSPYLKLIQGDNEGKKAISIPLLNAIKPARIDRFFPFTISNGQAEVKLFNGSGDITASQETDGIIYLPKEQSFETGDLMTCYFY